MADSKRKREPAPGWLGRIRTSTKIGIAGLILAALAILVPLASEECWWGLGSCPAPLPDIRIDTASSLFNSPGDDDPVDEYVCLISADDAPVDLAGWELRESGGDVVNTLPSFILAPASSIRVHPGEGRNSKHNLFGENGSPIWTNSGDSVTLIDASGEEIASVSFGEQDEGRPAGRCG